MTKNKIKLAQNKTHLVKFWQKRINFIYLFKCARMRIHFLRNFLKFTLNVERKIR